ncbi:MAG: hypothetical protein F6K19_45480 [Cyanothece sp. SIO1E1]|nr:hypothetical protein [Cyanothece sp. SIO1E1]
MSQDQGVISRKVELTSSRNVRVRRPLHKVLALGILSLALTTFSGAGTLARAETDEALSEHSSIVNLDGASRNFVPNHDRAANSSTAQTKTCKSSRKELDQAFQVALTKINRQDISAETKAVEVALLYLNYGHFEQAIDTLQAQLQEGNQSPMTFLMLADVYRIMGEEASAQVAYEQTLQLTSASKAVVEREIAVIAKVELANYLLEAQDDQPGHLQDENHLAKERPISGGFYALAESDAVATEAYGKAVMFASGSEAVVDRELLAIVNNELGKRLLEEGRAEFEALEAGAEQGELRERLEKEFDPSLQAAICGECTTPLGGTGFSARVAWFPVCASCMPG